MHRTLTDAIVDIVQNSLEAGATAIILKIQERQSELTISVADNGRGMSAEVLESVRDPFSTDGVKHPSRSVGLGVSFLHQIAQQTEGQVDIKSEVGLGTSVECRFDTTNIDLPPVGSLIDLIVDLCAMCGEQTLTVVRERESARYTVSTDDLRNALEDLTSVASLSLVRKYVESCEDELMAAVNATT